MILSLKARHFSCIASEIELMMEDVNMAEGHVAVTMAIQKKEILSFVHFCRKNPVNYNIRVLNMIHVNPFAIMRYHPSSIRVYQTKCSRSSPTITVCINRKHLNLCSHVVGITNCPLFCHHGFKKLAQLSHIRIGCTTDSNFINPHNPDAPGRLARQNTRQQTLYWPSHVL